MKQQQYFFKNSYEISNIVIDEFQWIQYSSDSYVTVYMPVMVFGESEKQ